MPVNWFQNLGYGKMKSFFVNYDESELQTYSLLAQLSTISTPAFCDEVSLKKHIKRSSHFIILHFFLLTIKKFCVNC